MDLNQVPEYEPIEYIDQFYKYKVEEKQYWLGQVKSLCMIL